MGPALIPLRHGLSLNPELGVAASKPSDPPVSAPYSPGVIDVSVQPLLALYMGAGDLNSCSQACAANTPACSSSWALELDFEAYACPSGSEKM